MPAKPQRQNSPKSICTLQGIDLVSLELTSFSLDIASGVPNIEEAVSNTKDTRNRERCSVARRASARQLPEISKVPQCLQALGLSLHIRKLSIYIPPPKAHDHSVDWYHGLYITVHILP